MKIAIVAFGNRSGGENSIALDIVSRIDIERLPVPAVVLTGERGPLKTLEIASTFDGLIIVDAGSMGEAPGTLKTFDLNDLVLGDPSRRVTLLGVKIDSELLFAHKYFGLPRTRIVCIESVSPVGASEDASASRNMDHYQEAIRQAIEQITA